jgi:hypothetical protein
MSLYNERCSNSTALLHGSLTQANSKVDRFADEKRKKEKSPDLQRQIEELRRKVENGQMLN